MLTLLDFHFIGFDTFIYGQGNFLLSAVGIEVSFLFRIVDKPYLYKYPRHGAAGQYFQSFLLYAYVSPPLFAKLFLHTGAQHNAAVEKSLGVLCNNNSCLRVVFIRRGRFVCYGFAIFANGILFLRVAVTPQHVALCTVSTGFSVAYGFVYGLFHTLPASFYSTVSCFDP